MPTECQQTLCDFFDRHRRIAVLTGAGISTASGIPDYRADDGQWKHARPVQYADFIGSSATRRRYWARSYAGWQRISGAEPNAGHRALATLAAAGRVHALITQNVDGLHRRAGSPDVIDLHGVLDRVRCLGCGETRARGDYQSLLTHANPDWHAVISAVAPDGDATLNGGVCDDFVVPACGDCGGIVKPDVVFFGEAVPADRVATASACVAGADALLVVGSSLMVFSGFRFVRQASIDGKPIAILNRGQTRAEDLATHRIAADCVGVLSAAAARFHASVAVADEAAH